MRLPKLLVSIAALTACGPPPEHPADAMPDADTATRSEVLSVPATVTRDVDVLVMVDDSPSTADKTARLKASFPQFITTLDALPGGRPNLHLGVVTSDVGSQGEADSFEGPVIPGSVGGCSHSGKAGKLQTQSTPLVAGQYISDVATTGGRDANYTGSLADAFSAIASVGAAGCGFEQPLHSIRLALTADTNPSFLRSTADLVVLVLSDEDDCSLAHSALLGNDPTLGPLQSFRCTQFGITCDQGGTTSDEMGAVGVKGACHSNESSPYLSKVADYASFLMGLKADPRNIMVGALVGDPDKVEVEMRMLPGTGESVTALKHSCSYMNAQQGMEVADPAVRIAELANQFQHHAVQSVCEDLSAGLADIGRQLASLQGSACLTKQISQPANCVVVDETAAGVKTTLPACPRDGHDCYEINADSAACPGMQNLKLDVTRAAQPDATTVTTVSCVLP